MSDGSSRRDSMGPFRWGLIGAIWLAIFQVKSYFPYNGLLNGLIIAILIGSLWGAGTILRQLQQIPVDRLFRLIAFTLLLALSGKLLQEWLERLTTPLGEYPTDITQNTVAAVMHFFEGKNPYGSKSQLWYTIRPGSHTTIVDQQVYMYGIRYEYGYPYFPLMFLTYVPFYHLMRDAHFMLAADGLLIVLSSIALFGLTWRLSPGRWKVSAGLLAVLLYLGPSIFSYEFIVSALPDMAMMTYLVASYWMMSEERPLLAGLLMGMTQACKLLPAPFMAGALLLWLWKRPGFWRFLLGFAGMSVLFIGPYFLRDPGLFVSSTILFYLTNHGKADNTSLCFYLPEQLQPILQAGGIMGSGATTLWVVRGREKGLLWPVSLGCSAYLIFIATAKMIHLNYFWAIYPVACAVLLVRLAQATDVTESVAEVSPIEGASPGGKLTTPEIS